MVFLDRQAHQTARTSIGEAAALVRAQANSSSPSRKGPAAATARCALPPRRLRRPSTPARPWCRWASTAPATPCPPHHPRPPRPHSGHDRRAAPDRPLRPRRPHRPRRRRPGRRHRARHRAPRRGEDPEGRGLRPGAATRAAASYRLTSARLPAAGGGDARDLKESNPRDTIRPTALCSRRQPAARPAGGPVLAAAGKRPAQRSDEVVLGQTQERDGKSERDRGESRF